MSELVIPSVAPEAWTVTADAGPVARIYRAELDTPFTSDQFYRLLEHIAPSPERDTHYGVVADWQLPDYAAHDRRTMESAGPAAAKLLVSHYIALEDLHKPLKQAWDGFMPSRKLFIHLVNDAYTDTSFQDDNGGISRLYDILIRPGKVDIDGLIDDYIDRSKPAHGILGLLAQAAGHTTPKAQKDFATEHLGNFVRGLRGKNKHISTPRALSRYLESQRPSWVRMLTKQAVYHAMQDDPELAKQFGERLTDIYCAPITVDGRPYLYRKRMVVDNIDRAIASSEEISNGTARARVARVRVRTKSGWERQIYGNFHSRSFILPGTIEPIEDRPMSAVTPIVRWLKHADGSRQFLLDEPIEPEPGTKGTYESNLFGVLVLAHMCPSIRERWPKQVGLPGSKFRQAMGIAQVPVLTLFEGTKRKLLDSAVINDWEAQSAAE